MKQAASLQFDIDVPAAISEVWHAWTTEEGVRTFFTSQCHIDLRLGGAYEMYFNLDAPPGSRGSEGCVVRAFEEPFMLSFTWNAPPELPSVRFHHTHVMIHLSVIDENNTNVKLTHDGWGSGEDWQKARQYFTRAWGELVLPRLKNRFIIGPKGWGDQ